MKPQNRIHYRNAGAGNGAGGTQEPIANLAALATQLNSAFTEHADAVDEALAERDTTLAGIRAQIGAIEQRLVARPQGGGGGGGAIETLGERFTRSAQFEAFRTGGLRQGMVFAQSFELERRAVTAEALGGRDRIAEIGSIPKRRPRIRDLLRVVPTTQSSIEFVRQTTFTNNADMVSEGALKPETTIDYELEVAPCRTLAHWVPASRQVLDDVEGLSASIDADLINGLELVEETQILLGDNTGQNLFGIIPQASAFAPVALVSPTDMDVVAAAIKQLVDIGVEPDGIVLNSSDWLRMQVSKDSIGQYYSQGGPFGGSPGTLWNRTVVATPAMNAGEFLVGGFNIGASLHDRMVANVLISTEDRDNFIRNMVTILAEERVALAVRRPQAFVTGSLSQISSGA